MRSGNNHRNTFVLDSSVIFAILLKEPDYQTFLDFIDTAKELLIGAPTLAEAGIVMQSRQGPSGLASLLMTVERWNVCVLPFTNLHAIEAIDAYQRFGKGRHPAALNMGDCNSYAIAKVAGATLLYKGGAFAQTDLPKLTPPA